MARKREKLGSLTHQCEVRLKSILRLGESRHEAKKNGTSKLYIYAWETFRSYLKAAVRFVKWCKEQNCCRTLEECRRYVRPYMDSCSNLAASTQKQYGAALAKLYGETSSIKEYNEMRKEGKEKTDFTAVAKRSRATITRSRGEKVRDKGFNEKIRDNAEYANFCRAVGLRASEVKALRGTDLAFNRNGRPYLKHIKGKGGKYRDIPIIDYPELVIAKMTAAGSGKVIDHLPSHADTHSFRADYANSLYRKLARPIEQIPKEDRYICRKDRKGIIYDRKAMKLVSKALGHNRVDVIAGNYLWRESGTFVGGWLNCKGSTG